MSTMDERAERKAKMQRLRRERSRRRERQHRTYHGTDQKVGNLGNDLSENEGLPTVKLGLLLSSLEGWMREETCQRTFLRLLPR